MVRYSVVLQTGRCGTQDNSDHPGVYTAYFNKNCVRVIGAVRNDSYKALTALFSNLSLCLVRVFFKKRDAGLAVGYVARGHAGTRVRLRNSSLPSDSPRLFII